MTEKEKAEACDRIVDAYTSGGRYDDFELYRFDLVLAVQKEVLDHLRKADVQKNAKHWQEKSKPREIESENI